MFRRRPTLAAPSPSAADPVAAPANRLTSASLAADGWLLPKALASGSTPTWTVTGTVGSELVTPVDPAGLVAREGWSLDWWIGADDRWHVPAREAAVRQSLVGDTPVVETLLRVPGGDAVHRAYGIRSPRAEGDEWVVVEIENRTPVPFAVALAIRPFVPAGLGDIHEITIEKVRGGKGRDGAHLLRVDGAPAVVLPRAPARFAAGSRIEGDAIDAVLAGKAGTEPGVAACPDGLANVALVFPLPHTAVLRVALPVGIGSGAGAAVEYPTNLPEGATVASGWDVHRRAPRVELPDDRLTESFARARCHVLLAHDGRAVRRDGQDATDLEPGATEVILGALDALDRPAEVDTVIAGWPDRLVVPEPPVDALVLESVAFHWLLHRSTSLLDWVLPEVAASIERLDRAERKGRLTDDVSRSAAARALRLGARLLQETGQADAAAAVDRLVQRFGATSAPPRSRADAVQELLGDLSVTGVAASSGRTPRIVHDLARSAELVLATRDLLCDDTGDGLDLLPEMPDTWFGGAVEVHDAPTAYGQLSYAIRWHGARPALLWDLDPHPSIGPVRIRVPGLDPDWSTTETRGDALLAEVAAPEGLDLYQLVAEHPDIDPAMRRPGAEPEPGPGPTLPEGGSFS